MEFIKFKTAVQNQFEKMAEQTLFRVDTDSDCRNSFWDTYLASYPPGTNPIHKERTEYDCQCCKQFIRNAAGIVTIVNNELVSIWDIDVDGEYGTVANALAAKAKAMPIATKFVYYQKHLGTDQNHQLISDTNEIITWGHFYLELPTSAFAAKPTIPNYLSDIESSRDVFKRGLEELVPSAFETVIELIHQNSIYRGEEFLKAIKKFYRLLKDYNNTPARLQDNFTWANLNKATDVARLRNTAMGTLLTDLSNDIDVNEAVGKFESMVAPTNYKRPTALITKSMIHNAQKEIEELGLTNSLQRRYAIAEDLAIVDILFANRASRISMSVFDEMVDEVPDNTQTFSKVEEVSIKDFMDKILPTTHTLSIMPENSHNNNFVSLIAPIDLEAPLLFKWKNNFSWAYKGDVTDSIKQRVKAAGGNVTGHLRCSLSWFNYDDLDIHVIEPSGNKIFYCSKQNPYTKGKLDVDMNVGNRGSRKAVENITWPNKNKMLEGTYQLIVHNYTKREDNDKGFSVELECNEKLNEFHYPKIVRARQKINVVTFEFTKTKGISIIKSIDSTAKIQNIWGINTNSFQEVKIVMLSPNYWIEGQEQGNKHVFFMLKNCINEEPSRGFFNEFLKTSLQEHRKVLEILGSKTKTACSINQLSGLGFSSTQRNSVLCKLTGKTNRVIRINF